MVCRCDNPNTKSLYQALGATRGDRTLHHEYSFRPTVASLHPGTYTSQSASFIGGLLLTHSYLPFSATFTAAVTLIN